MTGRLPRRFSEPGFTRASIRFAQAISDELIYAADLARPAWAGLASAYPDDLARIPEDLTQNPALFRTPLVWGIAVTWTKFLRWPVTATFRDGIGIGLPADLIHDMGAHGRLDAIEFFLAGLADVCCGRLGSNDHDLRYGLYVNVPIWIQLGVEPQWRDSFNRQLRMVIFHETAHFRWIGDEPRNEHMAHARGVASLRTGAWPSDRAAMAALLEREHPEAWHNPEIRGLILETSGGARLVRAWADRIAAATGSQPRPARYHRRQKVGPRTERRHLRFRSTPLKPNDANRGICRNATLRRDSEV